MYLIIGDPDFNITEVTVVGKLHQDHSPELHVGIANSRKALMI